MATYFTRYYLEFKDVRQVGAATWRVDILDSQGVAPTEPYKLTASAEPLITKHTDASEDKFTPVIGREINIGYMYTGNASEPLPDEFFDAEERRFRAHVYKNGVLDGVYYIKPDFSQYPDIAPPFVVKLTAIDGMGYADGTSFNAYGEDGLLYYTHISWWEALVQRALYQIFDSTTPVNVLNTMLPEGETFPSFKLLRDVSVHTDMFYDFVEGPNSVLDVLHKFCTAFKSRIISDGNEIWIQRIDDMGEDSYSIDKYTDETTISTSSPTDFVRSIGSSSFNDGYPTDLSGIFRMLPALKKAEFKVLYKGINQVSNFDWRDWDGSEFDDWTNQTPVSVSRVGSGTIDDPWRAQIGYDTGPVTDINQAIGGPGATPASSGDIIEIDFKYRFNNTESFAIYVSLVGAGQPVAMGPGGDWVYIGGDTNFGRRILIKRTGNKREGSFSVKSQPIPKTIPEGVLNTNVGISILIFAPAELHLPSDGAPVDSVEIYPIKLSIMPVSDLGRHLNSLNTDEFSRVQDETEFYFIDTGRLTLSNSMFIGSPLQATSFWEDKEAGLNLAPIEDRMGQSVINQYRRSVNSWEASVYSNDIGFHNVIQLEHKPGKKYIQLNDTYNNRSCEHNMQIAEVYPENNDDIIIQEYDIQDAENN